MHLLDKVLQHRFGHVEIGDDAIFQWPDGADVAGCAAQHTFSFAAHCRNRLGPARAAVHAHRNHRGLVQDNTAPTHVNQRICGTQIN